MNIKFCDFLFVFIWNILKNPCNQWKSHLLDFHHKQADEKWWQHFLPSGTHTSTYSTLTHFMPLVSFYTLWKYQKTSGFLILFGGPESDQWYDTGYTASANNFK